MSVCKVSHVVFSALEECEHMVSLDQYVCI